jgi:CubicO group peptidase (beta-lactamase class C family)
MHRLAASAALAAALLLGVPLHAADSLVLAKFSEYLEGLRVQTGIPGMAAMIVAVNDIAFERTFGQQDVERSVATQPTTPFHLDGLTQTMTAALVLRCVEEGRVSLEDPISRFSPGSADGTATIRQVLSHTQASGAFSYQPQRLDALKPVVEVCNSARSFRAALASMLEHYGMMLDSVPGPDAVGVPPSTTGIGQAAIDRYRAALERLAVPYTVDARGRVSKSQYSVTGLTGGSGLISSVREYAKFDLALKNGNVMGFDTLSQAWTPQGGRPHGLGWFVQNYNGERVVWAFGQSDNASSSLVVILPARSMTLVLLANSDGLSKGFGLENGDLNASPFGKLFLGLFVR